MSDIFKEISPKEIEENIFSLFDNDWALLTAGCLGKCNTMTVSWGSAGILWKKPVAVCFVRPQRYTYEFMEKSENFTISFFPNKYHSALELCGKKSGREVDKFKESGLTAIETSCGVAFAEAKLILGCKKIYFDDFKPENFLISEIANNYPKQDYHRIYIGEILECLTK